MAANSEDIRDEILRLRTRMHNAESELIGLKLHNENFAQWRNRIEPIIEDLREADRIADAVANKVNEQRNISLTKVQKRVAVFGVVVAFLALILDVVFRLIHLVQIS